MRVLTFLVWILLANSFLIVVSSHSNFTYEFSLQPTIYPDSNVSFALRATNTHPFDSIILSFSISPLNSNVSISNCNSSKILAGSTTLELITLPISSRISYYGLYKLQTRTFLVNEFGDCLLVKETFHELQLDLRKSQIIIHQNRDSGVNLETGEKLKFSVVVLDKYLKPVNATKTINLSLWSLYPKNFLIKRWEALEVHPEKPFITGVFEIPPSYQFYNSEESPETYAILATIDERHENDSSIREGLKVPQSLVELSFLIKFNEGETRHFFTYNVAAISSQTDKPKLSKLQLNGKSKIFNKFVTYKNPTYIVEVTAANSYGRPVQKGFCNIKVSGDVCAKEQEITLNFTQGTIKSELDFLDSVSKNCSSQEIFENLVVKRSIFVFCKENSSHPGYADSIMEFHEVYMTEYDYIICGSVLLNQSGDFSDTILIAIKSKDGVLLGMESDGNEVTITYVLSSVNQSVTDKISHTGILEHKLIYSFTDSNLSRIVVEYKDTVLTLTEKSLKTEPQKILRQEITVSPGEEIRLPVLLQKHHRHSRVMLTARRGEITEKLWPLISPPKEDLRFVGFLHVHVPFGSGGSTIRVTEDGHVLKVKEKEITLSLNGNVIPGEEVTFTPEINGSAVDSSVFALASGPVFSNTIKVVEETECTIKSENEKDGDNSCRRANILKTRKKKVQREKAAKSVEAMELIGNGEGVTLDEETRDGESGQTGEGLWLWKFNQKAGTTAALNITTRLPSESEILETPNVFGILIDEEHSYRLTESVYLHPKIPVAVEVKVPLEVKQGDNYCIKIQVINNVNISLDNFTMEIEDTTRAITFPGSKNSSKIILRSPVGALYDLSFSIPFNAEKFGSVTLLIRAVGNEHGIFKSVKFSVIPKGTKMVRYFPVFVNNTKGLSVSSTAVGLPPRDLSAIAGTEKLEVKSISNFLSYDGFLTGLADLDLEFAETGNAATAVKYDFTLLEIYSMIGVLPKPIENLLLDDLNGALNSVDNFIASYGNVTGEETNLSVEGKIGVSVWLLVRIAEKYAEVDAKKLKDLVEFLLEEDNFTGNQSEATDECTQKFSVYNKCHAILGLVAAKNYEAFSDDQEFLGRVAAGMEKMTAKLLKDEEHSETVWDLNLLTRLLFELNHPKAKEYFKRLELNMERFIRSDSPYIIVEQDGMSSSDCDSRVRETVEATSVALLNYMRMNKMKETFKLASGILNFINLQGGWESKEAYFFTPTLALAQFAGMVEYEKYGEQNIKFEIRNITEIGNQSRREVEVASKGRGMACAVVVLSYFTPSVIVS